MASIKESVATEDKRRWYLFIFYWFLASVQTSEMAEQAQRPKELNFGERTSCLICYVNVTFTDAVNAIKGIAWAYEGTYEHRGDLLYEKVGDARSKF